jgi:hypothetical protein
MGFLVPGFFLLTHGKEDKNGALAAAGVKGLTAEEARGRVKETYHVNVPRWKLCALVLVGAAT